MSEKTMFSTIDECLNQFSNDRRLMLETVRGTIRQAAPDCEERMSWQMPTFWQGKNLIHFAAAKKHLGIFPGAEAVEAFSPYLSSYNHFKGTIQIPYTMEMPLELISALTRYRVALVSGKPEEAKIILADYAETASRQPKQEA
jgi:uncharacterized protein YdhG (YjbR/CyaY superfamily)